MSDYDAPEASLFTADISSIDGTINYGEKIKVAAPPKVLFWKISLASHGGVEFDVS